MSTIHGVFQHPARAKLTPEGRLLVVTQVVEFGWTPAQTAEGVGVSRATAYKWLRGFREEGQAGFPIWTGPPGR